MTAPTVTYTFVSGNTASSAQVNQNFSDIIAALTDGSKAFSIEALTLAGTLSANAAVVLGASSANDLTINGSLASNLAIKTNNTYGIGGSTLGLSGVYFGAPTARTTRITANQSLGASNTLVLPNGNGTSRYYMETDGSGNMTWVKPKTIAGTVLNFSLTNAVGSSALTMTLKGADGNSLSSTNPVLAIFRNATPGNGGPTELEITSDLTLTISNGSTLGAKSATTAYLYWYLINDGGTPRLGVSQALFDSGSVVSSTAEGGGGASDSSAVLYTGTAVSAKACILIARSAHSLTTAGVWDEVADEISLMHFTLIKDKALYTSNNAQNIDAAGSGEIVIFETKVKNVRGNYNSATGVFTAGAARTFIVMSLITYASTTWTAGNQITISIRKNSAAVKTFQLTLTAAVGDRVSVQIFGAIDCSIGDTIDIFTDHNRSGGDVTLTADHAGNFIDIVEQPE